jgi:hypothetical protein
MAMCPNGHDSASDDFCDVCGIRIGARTASGPPSGTSSAPAGSTPLSTGFWTDPSAGTGESCPRCGTTRAGQFCEACGFSFNTPTFTPASPAPPPAPVYPPGPMQPGPMHSGPVSPTGPTIPPPTVPPPVPSYSSAPMAPQASSSFPYPQTTWTAIVGADRAYYERVQAVTGPEGAAVAFPSYCAERRFQLLGTQMRIGRRSVSRGLAPEIDLTGPPADPGISRLHAVLVAAPDGNWTVLDPGSANGTLVNGNEIAIGHQIPLHDGDRINLGAWTAITVHRN